MPPFNVISRRSTPETKNYKKVKLNGGLGWMTKIRNELARFFNGNHFSGLVHSSYRINYCFSIKYKKATSAF